VNSRVLVTRTHHKATVLLFGRLLQLHRELTSSLDKLVSKGAPSAEITLLKWYISTLDETINFVRQEVYK